MMKFKKKGVMINNYNKRIMSVKKKNKV